MASVHITDVRNGPPPWPKGNVWERSTHFERYVQDEAIEEKEKILYELPFNNHRNMSPFTFTSKFMYSTLYYCDKITKMSFDIVDFPKAKDNLLYKMGRLDEFLTRDVKTADFREMMQEVWLLQIFSRYGDYLALACQKFRGRRMSMQSISKWHALS